MGPPSDCLPQEIELAIVEELRGDDGTNGFIELLNWSSTCSYYRTLLGPMVFETIRLSTQKNNLASMKSIMNGEAANFVKRIDLTPDTRRNCGSEGCDTAKIEQLLPFRCDCGRKECPPSETEKALPADLDDVLSNLSKLPNLETLTIKFLHEWDWTDGFYDDMVGDPPGETSERVHEVERTQCWRACMANVYNSLAKNVRHPVKQLSIHDFVMREVSIFSTPDWHRFLNQLEVFEMDIPGGDNGACWDLVAWDAYPLFTSKLDKWFFNHLTNAKKFTLHPHETVSLGPLGSFPLRSGHLPHLRHIELTNVFISQDLVNVFIERAPEIETIIMRDVRFMPTWSENITWAHMMNSLADAQPRRLVKFDPRPLRWPDGWEKVFDGCEGEGGHERINEMRKCQPDRMVFLYATHQDKYKFRWDENICIESEDGATEYHFNKGEDQCAFDRLMAMVYENQHA